MLEIGVHYKKPTAITIHNGVRIICKEGLNLITTKSVCDEADLHYFKKHIKRIPENTSIRVDSYWKNFYGDYIRTVYDGNTYDINPEYLKYR